MPFAAAMPRFIELIFAICFSLFDADAYAIFADIAMPHFRRHYFAADEMPRFAAADAMLFMMLMLRFRCCHYAFLLLIICDAAFRATRHYLRHCHYALFRYADYAMICR